MAEKRKTTSSFFSQELSKSQLIQVLVNKIKQK